MNSTLSTIALTCSCFLTSLTAAAQLDLPLIGENGEKLLTLGSLYDAELSPDGQFVVTVGPLGAYLWDVETGKLIRTFSEDGFTPDSIAITPDGTKLLGVDGVKLPGVVMGTHGGSILWDIGTGEEILSFNSNPYVMTLSLSPDGRYALYGYSVFCVIRNLETGELVNQIGSHNGTLSSANYSPDMKYIVTGSEDDTAKLWDAESGELLQTYTQTTNVDYADFSPDGQKIMTRDANGKVYLWDTHTGERLVNIDDGNMKITQNLFSPDGKTILTIANEDTVSSNDSKGKIIIRDVETGTILQSWNNPDSDVKVISLLRDGRYFLIGTYSGQVQLWGLESGKVVRSIGNHSGTIDTAVLSPDGSNIFVGGDISSNSVILDAKTGNIIHSLPDTSAAISADYSSDGQQLVMYRMLAGDRGELWDTGSVQLIQTYPEPGTSIVSLSSDGSKIAFSESASQRGQFGTVRDSKTGDVLVSLELAANGTVGKTIPRRDDDSVGYSIQPLCVSHDRTNLILFSPDDSMILTGSVGSELGKDIYVWNPDTGTLIHTLSGHDSIISSGKFSQDGQKLFTGDWDGFIKVWDTGSGEELMTLSQENSHVTSIDISPDGRYALAGYKGHTGYLTGKTLILWDVQTGEMISSPNINPEITPDTPSNIVMSVAFYPDGDTFMTASSNGVIRLWSLADVIGTTYVESFELY